MLLFLPMLASPNVPAGPHPFRNEPGTRFQTSELSEIHTCKQTDEIPSHVGEEDADGMEEPPNVSDAQVTAPYYEPPTEVFCGKELRVSPCRARVNIYGYPFGSKWKEDRENLKGTSPQDSFLVPYVTLRGNPTVAL